MDKMRVILETGLERDQVLLRADLQVKDWSKVQHYDTWTITNHPTPDGQTFTLYACSIVLQESEAMHA